MCNYASRNYLEEKILFHFYIGEKMYWEDYIMKRMGCTIVPWCGEMISIVSCTYTEELMIWLVIQESELWGSITAVYISPEEIFIQALMGRDTLAKEWQKNIWCEHYFREQASQTPIVSYPALNHSKRIFCCGHLCCSAQVRWYVWHWSILINNARRKLIA